MIRQVVWWQKPLPIQIVIIKYNLIILVTCIDIKFLLCISKAIIGPFEIFLNAKDFLAAIWWYRPASWTKVTPASPWPQVQKNITSNKEKWHWWQTST